MVSLWLVSHEHSTSTGAVISTAVIARHPPGGHATQRGRCGRLCQGLGRLVASPWTWLVVDLRRGAP